MTIRTEWSASGLRGWLERMMAPSLLRRVYAEELAQLAALFAAGSPAPAHGPDGRGQR